MADEVKTPPKRLGGLPSNRFSHEHVDTLIKVAEERMFWHEARKRLTIMRQVAVGGASALILLSLWWPWIQEKVTALLSGIPK